MDPAATPPTRGTDRPLHFEDTAVAFAQRTTRELRRARWMFGLIGAPWLVRLGSRVIQAAVSLRLPIGWALRPVFDYFCGGETIRESRDTAAKLHEGGVRTILDYSAEGQSGEAALDAACAEIRATITEAHGDDRFAFAVFKVSALSDNALLRSWPNRTNWDGNQQAAWNRVVDRVSSLCTAAAQNRVRIMIDAEETWLQDAIDDIAEAQMRTHNPSSAMVFTTAQLYRHDRLQYIRDLTARAREQGWIAGVKLVRGAYMEKERDRAALEGRPSPIQPDKSATDRDFDAALDFALSHLDHVHIVCGTHNESSTARLAEGMLSAGISPDDPRVSFAQLLGMSDHLSFNLAHHGYTAAKYVPYGPLREAIPYLIRRAEENTSVGGQTSRELSLIRAELTRRRHA